MPSPTCDVKDGAGAYVATTNGVDVTAGNTITIRLNSTTGVTTWSISLISTDETAPNPTLTVDSVTKTATFTAPAVGTALRFRSRVNNRIGADGTVDNTLDATFVVHVLAANGQRVLAFEETTECGAYGWVPKLNSLIRNTTTPTSTTTERTGNARLKIYSNIADLVTTDATTTTIYNWTILDEAVTAVTVEATAIQSDGSTTATYVRRVRIKRDGGSVTVSTPVDVNTDEEGGFSTCEVTIDNSTSTGRVRVTGVAATTIYWGVLVTRLEMTHP